MTFYIETPRLTRSHNDWYLSAPNVNIRWGICGCRLRQFFNMSVDAEHICFRAYKDPAEERVKLDLGVVDHHKGNCTLNNMYVYIPIWTLNEIKKIAMGLTLWYVEVITDA